MTYNRNNFFNNEFATKMGIHEFLSLPMSLETLKLPPNFKSGLDAALSVIPKDFPKGDEPEILNLVKIIEENKDCFG
jgi:hypothetical protein